MSTAIGYILQLYLLYKTIVEDMGWYLNHNETEMDVSILLCSFHDSRSGYADK